MSTSLASRTPKNLVLAICCLSLLIVSMDATIVNVALPSIRAEFGTSITGLQWTVDAYTLTIASFLLLSGSTADRFGRRRVFQIGLVVFSIGSLLCSVAPSIGFLVFARVIQGLGGSMLNPVAMSIITNTFTVPKERARAVGVWGAIVGVSMALGPIVGGALTESVGWRSVFWVNIPIGIAAIVLTAVFVPESKAPTRRLFDPIGQGLVVVALVALIYGLIEASRVGWGSSLIVGLFALAVIAVVLLVRHAKRSDHPFVDVRFFGSVPFSSATITAVLGFASYGAFLFVNALYLQDVRGRSALNHRRLHAAAGADDAGRLTAVGPNGWPVRDPPVVGDRRVDAHAQRAEPDHPDRGDVGCQAAALLRVVRPRLRDDQRAHHDHRGVRDAVVAGGCGGGLRLHEPAGRGVGRSRSRGTVTGVGASRVIGAPFALATHPLWWIVAGCGSSIVVIGLISTSRWARDSALTVRHLLEEPVTSTRVVAGAEAAR